VMREAFLRAKTLGAVLIQHCEYKSISAGGVMHLGEVSREMDLPGLDPRAEEAMIERDIGLCRETGARYHVAHVSTAKAVHLVRRAKAEGLPVTAEVSAHHLVLTHQACVGRDPNTKMHPPLRTLGDVAACRHGLRDGTIDCIVTDHAPHGADEKAVGFLEAPPGIIGLETALGLAARAMIETGLADWQRVIEWFTGGAARVLGLPSPSLTRGVRADLTIIDPHRVWTVDPDQLASKSRNTPFAGWGLTGRAVATIRGPRVCRPAP
jgi:dihydroorotase